MAVVDPPVPAFLYGTFDWNANGYSYADQPPPELRTRAGLESPDPFIEIAAVCEHAKRGDFAHVRRLRRFIQPGDPLEFARLALWLVGDMAAGRDLHDMINDALTCDDAEIRMWAAEGACLSGHIDFVDAMVTAWERAETHEHHENIGYAISGMLEGSSGEIEKAAGVFILPHNELFDRRPELKRMWEQRNEERAKQELLPAKVARSLKSLRVEHPDCLIFWRGAPWDVRTAVTDLVAIAKNAWPEDIRLWRHKFEASTGWDCRRFFRGGQADPLGITAVMEEFLDAGQGDKYEPCVRYFFGHRIPD